MNKYIEYKNQRKYKKLETTFLENITLSSVSKMLKVTKKNLLTEQSNKLFN